MEAPSGVGSAPFHLLDHGVAAQVAMLRAEQAANRRTRGLIEKDVDPRGLENEVRRPST